MFFEEAVAIDEFIEFIPKIGSIVNARMDEEVEHKELGFGVLYFFPIIFLQFIIAHAESGGIEDGMRGFIDSHAYADGIGVIESWAS